MWHVNACARCTRSIIREGDAPMKKAGRKTGLDMEQSSNQKLWRTPSANDLKSP